MTNDVTDIARHRSSSDDVVNTQRTTANSDAVANSSGQFYMAMGLSGP